MDDGQRSSVEGTMRAAAGSAEIEWLWSSPHFERRTSNPGLFADRGSAALRRVSPRATVFLVLFLSACPVARTPAVAPVPPELAEGGGPALAAEVARVDEILANVDEIDRRDRLVELRDLLVVSQSADPAFRRRVAAYAARVIAIERRASPVGLAESPMEMADGALIVSEEAVGAEMPPAEPAPVPVAPPVDPAPVPVVPPTEGSP